MMKAIHAKEAAALVERQIELKRLLTAEFDPTASKTVPVLITPKGAPLGSPLKSYVPVSDRAGRAAFAIWREDLRNSLAEVRRRAVQIELTLED